MPAYIDNTICKKLKPTPLYVYKNLRNETGVSHSHDFIELTFIYEGRGEYEIDGRIYPVKTGDLLFISPGISHTTRITSGSLGLYSIAFTDVSFCQMPENTFFFEKEGPVYACPAKTAEKYDEIFTTMLKENTTNLPGKYFLMQSHLIQLLILIYRSINCPESALKKNITDGRLFPSGKKQMVNEIKNYLNDHYMDKISLDGIAQNMYLSPVYISRIFKEETGISPKAYREQILTFHKKPVE